MMIQSWTLNNNIHFWLYDRVRAVVESRDVEHVRQERERAERMGSKARRETFLATRSLLRRHLAEFTGRDAMELEIVVDENGKPQMSVPNAPSFSVSHSGDRILIAIASSGLPIGVDIERLDEKVDIDLLVRHLYSDEEKLELAQTRPEVKLETALKSWCRKEARFKLGDVPGGQNLADVDGKIGDYVFAACFLLEQPT